MFNSNTDLNSSGIAGSTGTEKFRQRERERDGERGRGERKREERERQIE